MAKRIWRIFVNEVIDIDRTPLCLLEEAGCEVILGRPMGEFPRYSEEEMIHWAANVDAFMGASRDPYTQRVIAASKRLQLISKFGVGIEKIDLKTASEYGVLVCNSPIEENGEAVAEHTIALMLALTKKLKNMETHLRAGEWRDISVYPEDLCGKTIGIIGLGRIGRAVAQRLQHWGVKLLFYGPSVDITSLKTMEIEKTGLDTLLRESDIVSLHLVAKPETHHFLNKEKLRLMKPTAYLINTARGEVIDESALVEALRENWIAGAGLDVFEKEPMPSNHPLLSFEQVLLTPHTAGLTPRSRRKILEKAVENCLSVFRGEIPPFLVNPEALPRWRERFGKQV